MTRTSNRRPLPYGRHEIGDDDIAAVTAVLRSDFLTTGPAVPAFEQALAERTQAAHAVACANGTAGLHLAALALGIGPGDAVVVPTLTFLATANAIRLAGAEVVFADVDSRTGLMAPHHLEEALSRTDSLRPRAVFPVHLTGQCVDMEAVAEVARRHDLFIVEDACHALGSHQRGQQGMAATGACAHSDMAVFSFHPVKTAAMGEGGAVTCADSQLARRLNRLRSHGMTREESEFSIKEQAFDTDGSANPWYYEMPEVGLNYRASDIACALGTSQLGKLDRFLATRAGLVTAYDAALAPLAPFMTPLPRVPWCDPAWHIYVVHLDFQALGKSRRTVMQTLKEQGIGTQVHYLPVHRQPYYRDRYGSPELAGADSYYQSCLTLPLFVGMDEDDVDRVVSALGCLLP